MSINQIRFAGAFDNIKKIQSQKTTESKTSSLLEKLNTLASQDIIPKGSLETYTINEKEVKGLYVNVGDEKFFVTPEYSEFGSHWLQKITMFNDDESFKLTYFTGTLSLGGNDEIQLEGKSQKPKTIYIATNKNGEKLVNKLKQLIT